MVSKIYKKAIGEKKQSNKPAKAILIAAVPKETKL